MIKTYEEFVNESKINFDKLNKNLLRYLTITDFFELDDEMDTDRKTLRKLSKSELKKIPNWDLVDNHYSKLFIETFPTEDAYVEKHIKRPGWKTSDEPYLRKQYKIELNYKR